MSSSVKSIRYLSTDPFSCMIGSTLIRSALIMLCVSYSSGGGPRSGEYFMTSGDSTLTFVVARSGKANAICGVDGAAGSFDSYSSNSCRGCMSGSDRCRRMGGVDGEGMKEEDGGGAKEELKEGGVGDLAIGGGERVNM